MKRLTGLGLCFSLSATLPSCTNKPQAFANYGEPIANCATGPDPYLSINAGDQITWSATDKSYTVVFPNPGSNPQPGTPFRNSQGQPQFSFPIGQGNMVASGPPHMPKGYYKYSIYPTLFAGAPPQGAQTCADPGLHVKD
jgi:hypothetical protein